MYVQIGMSAKIWEMFGELQGDLFTNAKSRQHKLWMHWLMTVLAIYYMSPHFSHISENFHES